jgi:DNA polymerase III delta subunit
MPRVSFEDFSRQVKRGDLPSAVYLYGEEDVLKEEIVRAILDRVLDPAARDFNLDQRSAAQLDPGSVETLCTTLPMMAERRVVVITEVEAWGKRAAAKAAVLRYLERPAAETTLILVQSAARRDERRDEADPDLAGRATAVQVDGYREGKAEKWVRKRAEERGISLTEDAATHLVRAVQGSLGAARSELDKLAGLGGDQPVTVDTLVRTLGVRRGETPGDWCEAVIEDRAGAAAEMLPFVLSQPGVSGVGLLGQLGTHLVGLGIARTQFDRGVRGGALERAVFSALLRIRPPRLDYRGSAALWSRAVERWPASRITAAIRAARAADRRLKNTMLSGERGILIDLIMGISPLAGRAA